MSGSRNYVETDASGETRVVAADVAPPTRARVVSRHDDVPADRATAWIANPHCAHCGESIERPEDAALVPSEFRNAQPRVAHRDGVGADGQRCFVAAIVRHNPTFSTKIAREREEKARNE